MKNKKIIYGIMIYMLMVSLTNMISNISVKYNEPDNVVEINKDDSNDDMLTTK